MAESAPVPSRGILTALRAAAIIIIATGLNEMISGAVPRYEPLYLYLAAVALVAWLDGVLLGALTAVAATAFYALLFLPRPLALSPGTLLPLAFAIAAAVVTGIARGIARSRSRVAAPPEILPITAPPLLTSGTVIVDNAEVLSAIDALRAELRTAAADRTRIAALEQDAATRHSELTALRTEKAVAEQTAAALRTSVRDLEHALEVARARASVHEAERGTLQEQLAKAEAAAGTNRGRITELERTLEAARVRAAEEREALQAQLAQATAEAHRAAEQLTTEVQTHENELSAVQEQLARAEAAAGTNRGRVVELERTLEASRVRAAEKERHAAEHAQTHELERSALQERIAELTRTLEAASLRAAEEERHAAEQLARQAATHETDRTALQERIAELEHGRSEEAASLTARLHDAERELADERAKFDQKLNTIVIHLAQDHEADLGKAVEEREESRAEARSLNMRVTALQKKWEEEKRLRDEALLEIERLNARIAELEKPPEPAPRTRILIAHPDADLRMNARASLERAGYEIVSAADGLEALRTAIAQRPAVVIADAVMPKMDGRELCQLLKSQEKTAHIRVILLTRATDEPPKGELLPDEVLHKPVPLETLKSTLASLLAEVPSP